MEATGNEYKCGHDTFSHTFCNKSKYHAYGKQTEDRKRKGINNRRKRRREGKRESKEERRGSR